MAIRVRDLNDMKLARELIESATREYQEGVPGGIRGFESIKQTVS